MRYSDSELLKLVGEERKRSIGFGEGESGELTAAREKALNYAKGIMKDVPSLPGRSAAVATTVADAVETIMPDLLEVFIGGDDVATFIPQGEQDEQAAKEESDFITHVVMVENPGFLNLYTAFKDALLNRTGILHWWMEDEEKSESQAEVSAEMAPMAQALASQMGQELEPEEQEDGTVALMKKTMHGRAKIRAFPCEDFTVASDTVNLRDATYCAVRDRPRVQDLIARGVDPDKARALKPYTQYNGTIAQARDEAGEHNVPHDSANDDLRVVETRAHYIRLANDSEDDEPKIWRIVTDAEETVLLEKPEECDQIPFAALTPFITPHRFYGESIADKLIEAQRLETAVLRGHMDQIYFALNQRNYVDESQANQFTISDLLRNEPGVPVRGKGPNAVTPIVAGRLNVDTLATMEYIATMAEKRSGVVRNAQGLNPDSLHDTAKGALALISAAQKRVRLIARIFAETGIKDLFLGVHCMMRAAFTKDHAPVSAKLGNSWREIQPNQWPERCAMAVHVGVGSAGKEHDLAIATQRLELMERLMQVPGAMGTLVDAPNVHNAFIGWERAAGTKAPESYWTDPAKAPPQEPKPDPKMAEVQGKLQLQQAQAQSDAQLTAQKHEQEAQASERKAQQDHERSLAQIQSDATIKQWQTEQELALKREQLVAELQLKREQLQAELELKRELGMAQAAVGHEVGMAKVSASTSTVEPGGEAG